MVIFESTDHGATKVFDAEGCVLEFNRQNINLIKTSDGDLKRALKSDSWICLIDDSTDEGKALVERAKKHKDFVEDSTDDFYNTLKFRIIDKVPTSTSGATIVKSFNPEVNKKLQVDAKRFGFLEGKLLKSDGTYRADAAEEDIAEYEALKKELE